MMMQPGQYTQEEIEVGFSHHFVFKFFQYFILGNAFLPLMNSFICLVILATTDARVDDGTGGLSSLRAAIELLRFN